MAEKKETDFLIIGAGVTGLAAAVELKEAAVVIEKEKRPGGLVKTHCFDNGYWFDHVLHILHFKDSEIQSRIQNLMGDILQPTPPQAWIVCKEGTAMYPFQLNLGALNEKTRNQCIADYAKVYFSAPDKNVKPTYKKFLEHSFGKAMCDIFYFPYNEKQYKYPLEEIDTDAILWNLHRPSFEEILEGSFHPNKERAAYNTNAFYPCPPKDAAVRGMEVLSDMLAAEVSDLRLEAEVRHIDTNAHEVHFIQHGKMNSIHYERACLATLPLTALMKICSDVPKDLLQKVNRLKFTKVISIGISIKGERPLNTGHWRYYPEAAYPFTRLIFPTAFDKHCAPADGWGILAEITWPGNKPVDEESITQETIKAIKTLGYVNNEQELIDTHLWIVDPAYVIFTPETKAVIQECFRFLHQHQIHAGGRYGKWEYSSMYQNIKEGFGWAKNITEQIPA